MYEPDQLHIHAVEFPAAPPIQSTTAESDTSNPAMDADVSVLMMPVMSALTAGLETSAPRAGAIWLSTPICVPSEPRFPNPQREYEAIIRLRGERSANSGSFVSFV